MIRPMEDRAGWFAVVTCFAAVFLVVAGDVHPSYNQRTREGKIPSPKCEQLCAEVNVKGGCQRASQDAVREEVIVMTNGSTTINTWDWDTITMVVTTYFEGISRTGLTSCVAHSKGKRYGLRESVPGSDNIQEILEGGVEKVKQDFIRKITTYQELLQSDHMVFDLLHFFYQLDSVSEDNKSKAIDSLNDILLTAVARVRHNYKSDVFCLVPWKPPCPENNCVEIRKLLKNCNVMVLSPDSYIAKPDQEGMCRAQATIPFSNFLYGVDRYMALRAQPFVQMSIVAGIPWHGYTYNCKQLTGDTCLVEGASNERCFNSSNRRKHTLSEIHQMNIPDSKVQMDEVNKAIYFNVNETAQMWFENFTTLFIKYQLVKDLHLKGLSIWYGEDMTVSLTQGEKPFSSMAWDFLTLQVLHKAVYNPSQRHHVYADTVTGIAIGCLLLGLVLGVVFTYIAMRRRRFSRTNRPFKLDEVDDEFRDDEGL